MKAYKLDGERWQYKFLLTIPESIVKTLHWREGVELDAKVSNGHLLIEYSHSLPKKPRRTIGTKLSYSEFRDKVRQTLEFSDGLSWTEIRTRLHLDQVVPNNRWVRALEKDIGLQRVRVVNGKIIWRINHVPR